MIKLRYFTSRVHPELVKITLRLQLFEHLYGIFIMKFEFLKALFTCYLKYIHSF